MRSSDDNYMLDLGIKKHNSIIFSLLIYLNKKGYVRESVICNDLCISREELEELYVFQEGIGYLGCIMDDEHNIVFYLKERGIEAYNNLVYDRDRFINSIKAYNEYINKQDKEKVKTFDFKKRIG